MLRLLFNKLFKEHLLLTNTTSCGCLLALGDALQQHIEHFRANGTLPVRYDWKRTGRMFAIGFVLGPMTHYWYGLLDKLYPKVIAKNVMKKILLDQIFGAPVFSFTFVTGMCKLEGQSAQAGFSEFCSKFPTIYLVDWCVWPPSQVVNFYLVPPHLRAMCVYFIDFCWYTFNSYIKHRDQHIPFQIPDKILHDYEDISPRL